MNQLIEMKNIQKLFPGVVALDDITFDIYAGEVHVLIGENGAGKSTLMKILSGVYTPTKGSITINGREFLRLTPKEAMENGISVIFQELSIIDELSVAENLFVGKIPTAKLAGVLPVVNHKYIYSQAQELLERVGLHVKPSVLAETLSISQKQQVEIAKALASKARVIIMDEPTSSLNLDEVDNLFQIIRSLKESGVGVVYISHKMRELREIGDRITVLKDGKTVATKRVEDVESEEEIVSMMVGRELKNNIFNGEISHVTAKVIFEAKHIVRRDRKVDNVSFELLEGEILGFAGLVGAGRTELMNVIYGSERMESGDIYLDGKRISVRSPYHSIKNGIGMITENRRETGFMGNFEIWRNISMALSLKESKLEGIWGLINRKREIRLGEDYCKKMRIKCTSAEQMVSKLSGGNQQKVIIAKWLAANARLLIFDEPTRGIDVGGKNEIYQLMRSLANDGKGIIMVSSELPELLSVCDRIVVFGGGKIKTILSAGEATEEKIMLAAT